MSDFARINKPISSFGNGNVELQCRYSRTVNVDSSYEVTQPQDQPVTLDGLLTYTMEVDVGNLGGTSTIRIIPNHSLGSIAPT